ncbi:MAG: UbiA family prenyltransferase [Deltaproteobacteria bacterium]|jgi:1,4-dihydroxy-2-naphthoate octaprenyltransferase|nr:UbiA family prenyltransferase [Deltaproteobacteria bacterium]
MSETQDPKKDDLALDEPVTQENAPDRATAETQPGEAKVEEPEAQPDEVKAEEPQTQPDEVKAEEPQAEEPQIVEAKAEEAKPDEVKPEEPKAEEAKAKPDEVKAEKTSDKASLEKPPVDKGEEKSDKSNLPQTVEEKTPFHLMPWIKASRPTYYVATLVPLFLGYFAAKYAQGSASVFIFVLILIASFLVHLATNLANDLFEHMEGVDTKDSLGGSRVIQEGQIAPHQLKQVIGFCYLAAFVLAIIIVKANPMLWIMVIFAALSSFFYVCPPIKYGHRGLGEVFVFLNMGLIMTVGTYMALTGNFELRIVSLALPVALGVAGILFYQSLPEIEDDAKVGKRTLAVKLGRERSTLAQSLWWPLIWVLMINLWLSGFVAWPAWLCLLTLPLHLIVQRRLKVTKDWRELDQYGLLVRLMYLLNGLFLILGLIAIQPVAGLEAQPPETKSAITSPAPAPAAAPAIEPAAAPEIEPAAAPEESAPADEPKATKPDSAKPAEAEPEAAAPAEEKAAESAPSAAPEPTPEAAPPAATESAPEPAAPESSPESAPPAEVAAPPQTAAETPAPSGPDTAAESQAAPLEAQPEAKTSTLPGVPPSATTVEPKGETQLPAPPPLSSPPPLNVAPYPEPVNQSVPPAESTVNSPRSPKMPGPPLRV